MGRSAARSRPMIRHLLKYGSLLVLLVLFFAHAVVRNAAAGRVFVNPVDLPELDTAIVLGTSRYSRGGGPNLFFEARMDAAAELIRGGYVRTLVVSGDNERPSYDEPAAMAEALMAPWGTVGRNSSGRRGTANPRFGTAGTGRVRAGTLRGRIPALPRRTGGLPRPGERDRRLRVRCGRRGWPRSRERSSPGICGPGEGSP
jgi:hypothetical protein